MQKIWDLFRAKKNPGLWFQFEDDDHRNAAQPTSRPALMHERIEEAARPSAYLLAARHSHQTGTHKLFGNTQEFAEKLRNALRDLGFPSNVSIAPNAEASLVLARSYGGATSVNKRELESKLAPLSLSVLRCEDATLTTLTRWGIRNLENLPHCLRRRS